MIKWNPDDEGKTHINIYSQANSELGRLLSNFARTPINHPTEGPVESIEGLWYGLSANDRSIYSLYGYEAKRVGRERKGEDYPTRPDFAAKILLGLSVKAHDYGEQIRELMLKYRELPYTHYYVFNNKQFFPKKGMWVIRFWETVRDAHLEEGNG